MANENKGIGEIAKKCKILLLDIEGTTTSISFVKDKLFPYAEENVKGFLEREWEADDTKEAVAALRKLALEDQEKSVEGAVVIPGEDASKEDQIEGLVNNVKWQMSSDRKAGPLKHLQGLIWKQGYDNGDIKGHVYDDVSAALEQWRSVEGQKVYIYSSGSVQAQKLLFGQSLAGDLLKYIDGHFDTAVGHKQEAASYTAIVEQIGVKPEDVLFLTDIVKEAEAARSAGLHVALVSREGNAPLPPEAVEAFTVLHSLAQLTVTNKRKNEPQDEQPAKVPKTDTDDDVKSTSESVVSEETVKMQEVEEQEKMEVEETTTEKTEKAAVNVETVIEDITDSAEPLDVPMVDVEPVVIEEGEKPSTENKTEIMDIEPKETVKVDEIETKTDQVIPNTEEPVTASHEVEKSDEAVSKSDKVEAKPDENGLSESNENLKLSEVPPRTEPDVVESSKPKDNDESKINEKTKAEPEKEKIEAQVVKEKVDVAEETPPTIVTEIEEITVENLGDVEEMIEDLEPVIEEPANEEMEDLKNVGEVLEKECDEILSKVQDVTNLDNIPLKSLHTIAEETMESELDAENMDSNDIVDRILDSELELEKQCNNDDIDLNCVSDITSDVTTDQEIKSTNENSSETAIETKPENNTDKEDLSSASETVATDSSQLENKNDEKLEDENENKKEESKKENDITEKLDEQESNKDNDKIENKDVIEKMGTTNDKIEEKENTKVQESKGAPAEAAAEANSQQSTDVEIAVEDIKNDSEKDKEACQVNGKATANGDAEIVNLNGDAANDEELNSRLSVENGKEAVNGSNGDSVAAEGGQTEKMEAEVSDIKVKTVATEEPRTDPIEQPTEA